MVSELREFVYLDELSVNSLLASQYVAVPEAVKEASENIEGDESGWSFGGSLSISGLGGGEISRDSSSSEEQRVLRETERKVNGQYRFSILHDVLEGSGELVDLSDSSSDNSSSLEFDSGDPIKIRGDCDPDPFFKLLNSITMLTRMFEAEQLEHTTGEDVDFSEDMDEIMIDESRSVFDIWRDILHGERIGLRVDSDGFNYPVVMSIDLGSLWTNPKREFYSTKQYTVIGRVDHVIGNEKWDYIDLVQIMSEVFTEDSVDGFRGVLSEVAENLEENTQTENEEEMFEIDTDIEESDYVVDGPAIVIDPVAIYW
ncbi:hypothetical protein GCM10009682_42600 [Luedemannella flava]|uniref:Uncharacterized protein n=1 Tax=Luedemannella flava TaxID=349316 RepID=A0ABN2MAQ2_9ACTN